MPGRHHRSANTLSRRDPQHGASLVLAALLITGLAALGTLMAQLMTTDSLDTAADWYASQALYAAESGVQWAIYQIEQNTLDNGSCPATPDAVVSGRSGFECHWSPILDFSPAGGTLYRIVSRGLAGSSLSNPESIRRLEVQYFSDS